MTAIKKISVFYTGWDERWAFGILADNGSKLFFEYTPEALSQGLELSPLHLKLSSETYGNFPMHQMRLPGLISDCLPDGWGLLLMDRLFRKHGIHPEQVSPLERLSLLENNGIGALTFVPVNNENLDIQDLKLFKIANEVQKIIENKASTVLPQLVRLGGSPQGARPKVLVSYDTKSQTVSTDPSTTPWLIKFQAKHEHKEVCAIEAMYADLAKKSGIEMSDTEYFDLGKFSAFGTKRFDRDGKTRIPVHTVAGALNADYSIPSSVSYDSFLRLTRLMTKDEREVYKAYRLCVFNVIFNNRDDHSKNFSFRLDKNRNWKLSPAYDLTFSQGFA